MILRRLALVFASLALLGETPAQIDSQYVLERYMLALASVATPKVVIYSYTVSQVGPSNIEQHHRIYRSGGDVRDETLSVDGIPLSRKVVSFSHHEERYTIDRFAPRSDAYEMLFLGTARDGHHLDYIYETTPLTHSSDAWIDRVTIDGVKFLPRAVHFRGAALDVVGSGKIEFGAFGKYWMPIIADAQARVKGELARESIVWSDYSFPKSLPPSTFAAPEPLLQASPTP